MVQPFTMRSTDGAEGVPPALGQISLRLGQHSGHLLAPAVTSPRCLAAPIPPLSLQPFSSPRTFLRVRVVSFHKAIAGRANGRCVVMSVEIVGPQAAFRPSQKFVSALLRKSR